MGYGTYDTTRGPADYAVDDVCHAEGCTTEIDRGLAFLCGDDPHSPAPGCGWWFCDKHLFYVHLGGDTVVQLCPACAEAVGEDPDGEDPTDTAQEGTDV